MLVNATHDLRQTFYDNNILQNVGKLEISKISMYFKA